jgi:hypothetical protein
MDGDAFAYALAFTVPAEVARRGKRVMFDGITQLHEVIARATPVDTGYLRVSLSVQVNGEGGFALSAPYPRHIAGRHTGAVLSAASAADASVQAALTQIKIGDMVRMGFSAHYAPYVEPHAGMIKSGIAAWGAIMDRAVQNAKD